jgi:hypothetical protein
MDDAELSDVGYVGKRLAGDSRTFEEIFKGSPPFLGVLIFKVPIAFFLMILSAFTTRRR